MKKNWKDKIIESHKTDFIYYSYFILWKICELDLQLKKVGRKTQVANVYNN